VIDEALFARHAFLCASALKQVGCFCAADKLNSATALQQVLLSANGIASVRWIESERMSACR